MNRTGNATRLPDAHIWQRYQTKQVLKIHPQSVKIVLLVLLVAGVVLLSACGTEMAQGTITGAYQPLRSGMVQMYINVELDDGRKVDAVLPVDQKIWDKVWWSVKRGGYLRVEIRRQRSDEPWEFVRFLDEGRQGQSG